MNGKLNTCCLCGAEFEGYGNNPAPLASEGRCCDACNEKVVSARFVELWRGMNLQSEVDECAKELG